MIGLDNISKRFFIIWLAFLLAFLSVVGKVAYIQFFDADRWLRFDYEPKIQEEPAHRGSIYACDGQLMASSVARYHLSWDTQTEYLRKHHTLLYNSVDSMALILANAIGDRSASEYKQLLLDGIRGKKRDLKLTKPKQPISNEQRNSIKKAPIFRESKNRGGLKEQETIARIKPFGSLAARTIGNLPTAASRGSGLELSFDSILRGVSGKAQILKLNSLLQKEVIESPVDGYDITTTIDIDMQDVAESVLAKYLQQFRPEMACLAVMEVKTGELKACVNMIRRENGNYAEDNDMLFTTRSEPGSTFKTYSMMVALEHNLVKPDDKIEVGREGKWAFYNKYMTDSHFPQTGYWTATQVIAESSNIGMSRIINDHFGKDKESMGRFVDEIYRLGVGKPLEFDIKYAAKPNVRHPKDEGVHWSGITLPWMSIGYETELPPIYTLTYYNGIANDGKLIKPFLVKSIGRNGREKHRFRAETLNSKMCSNQTLVEIRKMLREVVVSGTMERHNSSVVSLAGKTGTAQIERRGGRAGGHQVSFCGYFPAEKPVYSLIVVMRKPQGFADAGTQCGPVAREVAELISVQKFRRELSSQAVQNYQQPAVKSGLSEAVAQSLDELDIACKTTQNVWSSIVATDDCLAQRGIKVEAKNVPNVIGMGAKDAVCLLEKAGLRVQLFGKGSVRSQSLEAGSPIVRGQTISLTLR